MLVLQVGGTEIFDEETSTFSVVDSITVEMEHSLVSLSKWESKYKKPFLGEAEKSSEETLDYIRLMVCSSHESDVVDAMTAENFQTIIDYIKSPETATTFHNLPKPKRMAETVTSEIIYFWMVSYQLPIDAEKWNLNRLFALIQVCSIKNSDPKKMSRQEIANRNRELNAQRRAQYGTSG